jgi:hypothetical protein
VDPATIDENVARTRKTFEAIAPCRGDGRWLDYFDNDAGADAVDAAYGANRSRLADIERRYDPERVSRHNLNIPPAHSRTEMGI